MPSAGTPCRKRSQGICPGMGGEWAWESKFQKKKEKMIVSFTNYRRMWHLNEIYILVHALLCLNMNIPKLDENNLFL